MNSHMLGPGTEVWGEGSGAKQEPFQMWFPNENIPFSDLGLISILSLGSLPSLDRKDGGSERKEKQGDSRREG